MPSEMFVHQLTVPQHISLVFAQSADSQQCCSPMDLTSTVQRKAGRKKIVKSYSYFRQDKVQSSSEVSIQLSIAHQHWCPRSSLRLTWLPQPQAAQVLKSWVDKNSPMKSQKYQQLHFIFIFKVHGTSWLNNQLQQHLARLQQTPQI